MSIHVSLKYNKYIAMGCDMLSVKHILLDICHYTLLFERTIFQTNREGYHTTHLRQTQF